MPRWGTPQPVSDHIKERVSIQDRGYSSPCWIWQRAVNNCGYPTGRPAGYRHGVMHRASHEAFIGPIPSGHVVDHLCNVRACVNPDHLEAITQGENIRRSWERTRRQGDAVTADRKTGGDGLQRAAATTDQSMSLTHRKTGPSA